MLTDMVIFFVKKLATTALLLLLSASANSASNTTNQADVTRERLGLEVIETQLGKMIEHSQVLKTYSNQSANHKFNYQAFEIQLKTLQDQLAEYLEHPALPRSVDALSK